MKDNFFSSSEALNLKSDSSSVILAKYACSSIRVIVTPPNIVFIFMLR